MSIENPSVREIEQAQLVLKNAGVITDDDIKHAITDALNEVLGTARWQVPLSDGSPSISVSMGPGKSGEGEWQAIVRGLWYPDGIVSILIGDGEEEEEPQLPPSKESIEQGFEPEDAIGRPL